jgi:hypothetical protein
MVLYQAIHYILATTGPVVDNPDPVSPVNGTGMDMLISYAKWGALAACAFSAVISGGLMAVGELSNRPDHSDRGRRALLWSLAGAAVVALAIPTLNTIFSGAS